jgi:hypothetical protein
MVVKVGKSTGRVVEIVEQLFWILTWFTLCIFFDGFQKSLEEACGGKVTLK